MTLLPFLGQAAVLGTDNRLNLEELYKRNPLTLAKATATQINLKYLDSKGLYPMGKLQISRLSQTFAAKRAPL